MPDIGLLQGAPPRRSSPPPAVELQPAAAFTARVEPHAQGIAERFAALPDEAIVVVSAAAMPPAQAQPPVPPDARTAAAQPPPLHTAARGVAPIHARDLLWLALALAVGLFVARRPRERVMA